MNAKQQIEEMAECLIDIQQNFNEYCAKPCRACELVGIVNCENHYKSEALYNTGYRKQSEGEWIEKKRFYASGKTLVHYQCSLCGVYLATKANFCPNCGAKMKGGAQ